MPSGKGRRVIVRHDRTGEKKVMYVCPFPYERINPEDGTKHTDYNFGGNETRLCPIGKGSWCRRCPHYAQHKISKKKWMFIRNNIKKTGKAPHFWTAPSPEKVTDPLLSTKVIYNKGQKLRVGGI